MMNYVTYCYVTYRLPIQHSQDPKSIEKTMDDYRKNVKYMLVSFTKYIRSSKELSKFDALWRFIFVGHGSGGNLAGGVAYKLWMWSPQNEKVGAVWGNLPFEN